MIPHIIHQIWFQGEDNIPKKYPNYSKSWKEMNPKFKYIFWDGEKMEKLIKEKYPWFLKRYNEYRIIKMVIYIILYLTYMEE